MLHTLFKEDKHFDSLAFLILITAAATVGASIAATSAGYIRCETQKEQKSFLWITDI